MATDNQQAIVIGAGPGLGRSLALRYARAGYDLALLARDEQRLADLADEVRALGRGAITVRCDASDLDQVAEAIGEVVANGPVGVLHYNASVFGRRLIDTEPATLQEATTVNMLAPVVAVQAALPSLQDTTGTVLLTGGGLALEPHAPYGLLTLGKVGLRSVAGLLADDVADTGVGVRTLIIAGAIEPDTPFDPERIAEAFLAFHADPGDEVERVFTGSDAPASAVE